MSSNALESQGVLLQLSDGASPEVYTTIAEISDINFATGSASVIDTSDLESTAKEKRMGLPDEGQCSFTCNYIPTNTQHAALKAAKAARSLKNFKIRYTDSPNTVELFSAYVLTMPRTIGVDGVIQANFTLEISGALS